MNGEICCVLGICCPAGSESQVNALSKELVKDKVCSENPEARAVAAWMLKHFDLAPAGSLTQLKGDIAKLARSAKA